MIEEGNKKKEKSIAWEEGKDDEKTQAEEGREEETAKPTFSLISVLIFVSSSPKSLIGLILTPLFGLFIYNPFEFPNVEMCTNKFGDESMEKNMLILCAGNQLLRSTLILFFLKSVSKDASII